MAFAISSLSSGAAGGAGTSKKTGRSGSKSSKSTLDARAARYELVRQSDTKTESAVVGRLGTYDAIRGILSPIDPVMKVGLRCGTTTTPPSATDSFFSSSSPSNVSPVTPITPMSAGSPDGSFVSPGTRTAWYSPWYMAPRASNDAALRAFIKQPVSAEMVCFLTTRLKRILEPAETDGEMKDGIYEQTEWPSIRQFIANVVVRADIQTGTLMATAVYLERFRSLLGPGIRAMAGVASLHRIFLSCLVLTSKYLHDSSLKNSCWARCSEVQNWTTTRPDGTVKDMKPFQLTTSDVNLIEREMLARLEWKMSVSEDDLYANLDYFLAPIRMQQSIATSFPLASASNGSTVVLTYSPTGWPIQFSPSSMFPDERTPSLSPPSRAPSAGGPVYQVPLPPVGSVQTPITKRKSGLLHLGHRRSFNVLSSFSPIGKGSKTATTSGSTLAPPGSSSGQQTSGNSNLLHPSSQYAHHPYATYARGSRPRGLHTHSHSSASTASTMSIGSTASGSHVPIFGQPGFYQPPSTSSGLRPGSRHPHVRQQSSGVDQSLFDAAMAAAVAGTDHNKGVSVKDLMGVPSVERAPTSASTNVPDVKSSRISNFWSRLIAGRAG